MTLTLAKVLRELEQHRYELEVWTMIENQLCPYLDMDEHRLAEAGLRVTGCSSDRVPVEVFEQIIETIREDKIAPITARIEEIEGLNVQESDEEETDEKVTKKRKRKVTKKKGGTKSTGAKSQGQKRIRAITGRARRKSS